VLDIFQKSKRSERDTMTLTTPSRRSLKTAPLEIVDNRWLQAYIRDNENGVAQTSLT
jgi:hypothetical protein